MRRKMGWTVKGIIGFIFAPMGLIFVLIGLFVGKSLNVSWSRANDSVVFQSVFCGIGGLFLIIGIALLAADLWRRHLLQRAYDGGNISSNIILFLIPSPHRYIRFHSHEQSIPVSAESSSRGSSRSLKLHCFHNQRSPLHVPGPRQSIGHYPA